jgi:hypothetical protein
VPLVVRVAAALTVAELYCDRPRDDVVLSAVPGLGVSSTAEALAHLGRGWSVLPVLTDKTPATDLIRATRGRGGWAQLRSRPADADEVRAWGELDPAAGIGVLCGEASGGLVVVDVDGPGGPALPTTAIVSTARGYHGYGRSSQPVRTRAYSWGEIRAEGAYAVAPRSWGVYRWHLSPEEAGIADFDELELALAHDFASTELVEKSVPASYYVPACTKVADFDRDEQLALRLARALGVPDDVEIGHAFECLLHPERNPSASLWRADARSHVLYHDFHAGAHGDPAWLSLAAVRARIAGRRDRLSAAELRVWKRLLALEAGLLEPVVLEAPQRDDPVWDGFVRLLRLRWLSEPGAPTPFSARFAAAWCDVSVMGAHRAIRELERLGFLRVAGHDAQGTRLWLPPEGVMPLGD